MQVKRYLPKAIRQKRWLRISLLIVLMLFVVGGVLMAGSCATVGVSAKGKRLERIKTSPHFQVDRFVNSIPTRQPSFLRALGKWLKGASHTTPSQDVPVVKRGPADFVPGPQSGLRITWLGHSTSLVEIDGLRFLLDPMWSDRSSPFGWAGPKRFFDPPLALEDLPSLDAVLISHDHYDHLDKQAVCWLAATKTTFVVPLGIGADLEYWGIPNKQIVELDWWQDVEIGSVRITATPARHFSGRSLVMADRDETLWCGFAIRGPTHSVYYSGDTAMFESFVEIGQRLGPFDASLIEVGAYNEMWADLHLGPEQAVDTVQQVRGGLLIPVHWGTFDLALHSWTEPVERLLVAADGQAIQSAIPKPGQSVEPAQQPQTEQAQRVVRWWPKIPWQTAQEHPVASSMGSQDRSGK